MSVMIFHVIHEQVRTGELERAAFRSVSDLDAAKIVATGASRQQYVHVATVETDDLDAAWELTNSIEAPWTQNDGLSFVAGPRQRSSMMGDVFMKGSEAHVVAGCGFRAVPQASPMFDGLCA
jgi:hypothetical protein